jgi:hypothetical protein
MKSRLKVDDNQFGHTKTILDLLYVSMRMIQVWSVNKMHMVKENDEVKSMPREDEVFSK